MDLLTPYLQRLAADGNFSGAILAAEGDRQWLRSYGWADAASGRAMANDTPLRIGSLSKSFTAALVLRLVDDGLLALDQPLQPLLPQFKLPDALTASHLLRHRSGLGNHTALPDYWPTRMQQYWTPDQLINDILAHPPLFAPGEGCAYSNTAYALLARLLEILRGKPFAVLLRQMLASAGLSGIRDEVEAPATDGARGYWLATEWQAAPPLDISNGFGAYSLSANAPSLLRWWQALSSSDILSPHSRAWMFATENGEDGFAAGWYREHTPDGPVLSHLGDINGFVSVLLAQPAKNRCVIALSNLAQTDAWALAETVCQLLDGKPVDTGPAATGFAPLPDWLDGRYLAGDGDEIIMNGGIATLTRRYGARCDCAVIASRSEPEHCEARLERLPERLIFSRQAAGTRLTHISGLKRHEYRKISNSSR
ncbi:beta-lactamase family protein [Chromobacterium violaceum]|uniref:serine hydrolase domain-containing protein n=1 Tax=Chromobacterium violaceum TaxID=536 RepID=UPI001B33BB99|nr:serine hydrolase domain-containing protein [Chromobacterium violaceum]MBP4048606.1 beta-lactamase family protein [Chromobacterium violaceum]